MINRIKKLLFDEKNKFSSAGYWEKRYADGGNSGLGSYGRLAEFKAEVINGIIKQHEINSVIEFGCGDGNQLSLIKCKKYTGLDVSLTALQKCTEIFRNDRTKSFFLYDYRCFSDNQGVFLNDCAMSIDVLFHLVEPEIYKTYLHHLFSCASRIIIIYAANENIERKSIHEYYRNFTGYIEKHFQGWKLLEVIKNKYPAKNYADESGSLADFFIYCPVK